MKINDIIQVIPGSNTREEFWTLLFQVIKIHTWGVTATHKTIGAHYPVRLIIGTFEVVGTLAYIGVADETE